MKKSILTTAAAVLAAALLVSCGDSTPTVKIGVYEPASGDNGAGAVEQVQLVHLHRAFGDCTCFV